LAISAQPVEPSARDELLEHRQGGSRVGLETSELTGDEYPEEAGVAHGVDHRLGERARSLGLAGLGFDQGGELAGTVERVDLGRGRDGHRASVGTRHGSATRHLRPGLFLVDSRLAGKTQHALTHDVALDLGGASLDRVRP
jgi:hypothetical protein